MSRKLGELGGTDRSVSPRKPIQFTYFGVPLRTHPSLTELTFVDAQMQVEGLMITLPDGVDLNDPETHTAETTAILLGEVLPLIRDFLRRAIHPDDFDLFWRTAMDKGQNTVDLMGLFMQLCGEAAARPTRPSSGSSTGRRSTKKKSGRGGSLRVKRRYEKRGRPDLAEMVLIKMEHDQGVRASA